MNTKLKPSFRRIIIFFIIFCAVGDTEFNNSSIKFWCKIKIHYYYYYYYFTSGS